MIEKTNSPGWWPGFYEPFRHFGERIADWFAPRAEATASNAHYEITMELPGVTQEDIDVSLHEGVLTVKGDDVAADFSNGVLKITVPKLAEEKVTAKKIRVTAL